LNRIGTPFRRMARNLSPFSNRKLFHAPRQDAISAFGKARSAHQVLRASASRIDMPTIFQLADLKTGRFRSLRLC